MSGTGNLDNLAWQTNMSVSQCNRYVSITISTTSTMTTTTTTLFFLWNCYFFRRSLPVRPVPRSCPKEETFAIKGVKLVLASWILMTQPTLKALKFSLADLWGPDQIHGNDGRIIRLNKSFSGCWSRIIYRPVICFIFSQLLLFWIILQVSTGASVSRRKNLLWLLM